MKNILIVDDELLIRYSLASLFRAPDTETLSADTGIAALNIVRTHRLGLCLLDIHLPDLNGLDIMRALRAISPWTRIMIVTGTLITNAMITSVQENAHSLITKPFDLEEVEAIALRLLAPGKMPRGETLPTKKGSCVLWLADDARKHIRRPEERDIVCSIVAPAGSQRPVPFTVRVLDSSDSGIGILAPVELAPGNILRSSDGSMQRGSVVRWCLRSEPAGYCRAGIQFIAPQYLDYLTGTSEICWTDGERHGLIA